MPNAPTHDLITVATAASADIAYFQFTPHPDPILATIFTATFLFAGFACAGDLDLNSREYRRWGPLRFLWWPYRMVVPHRSWISHGFVWGGVIRALYLAVVSTAVFWLGLWTAWRFGFSVDATGAAISGWRLLGNWAQKHPDLAGGAAAGFVLAGTAHSAADVCSSGIKRRLRVLR